MAKALCTSSVNTFRVQTNIGNEENIFFSRKNCSSWVQNNFPFKNEIRKTYNMMKEIASDLERQNQAAEVKQLETAVAELLEECENIGHYGAAIEVVANGHTETEESTDFKKVLDDEVAKLKRSSSTNLQNHSWMRQLRQAVWNVHHAGQPMPGDEEEDIVLTSTQSNLLNLLCPVSGKPIIELKEPVRSIECKHIYELVAVKVYISRNKPQAKCPIAGCPRFLRAEKVVCDSMLLTEIDEMRQMNKETDREAVIKDFTALYGDDD